MKNLIADFAKSLAAEKNWALDHSCALNFETFYKIPLFSKIISFKSFSTL